MPSSGWSRHTMGQDWGGRRKTNPDNCPKITRKMIEDLANENHIEVWNDGYGGYHGTWLYKKPDGINYVLGSTNYIAFEHLKRVIANA